MTGADTAAPDPPGAAAPDTERVIVELYDLHARGLHRYLARRVGGHVADDLVAQTFLTAWQQRERYRPERGGAKAWLYGIATNLLRRHARGEVRALRAWARENGRAVFAESVDSMAVSIVDASRRAARLAGRLAELRAEERDVLLMVAWAGLSPGEVAQALGVPAVTVRSRLHRARVALRGIVQEEPT